MKYISKSYKPFQLEHFKNPIAKAFAKQFLDMAQGAATILATKVNPFRGVTIIIGGTHTGKSKFVSEFAAVLEASDTQLVANYALLEPTVDKYAHQLSHPAMVTIEQFIEELSEALANGVTTLFVDSFRVLQYDIGGQAVSGGMSTGVFALLTQLSELCYQLNVALIIPLNPNVKDDLYDFTVKNLKGSTHNIIDIEASEFSFRDLDRTHAKFKDVNSINEDVAGQIRGEQQFILNELAVTHFRVRQQPNMEATTDFVETVPATDVVTSMSPLDDPNTVTRIAHLNNI